MQIVVKQIGGYAGTAHVSSVDTARLDAVRRARVEQLVRDAADRMRAGSNEAIGADLMRYEITVKDNGETSSLAWTDDGTFGPMRQLIEEVQGLS